MVTACGAVTRRPNAMQVDQYVCACGYCCATLTSEMSAAQEAHIVAAFNRIHRERSL